MTIPDYRTNTVRRGDPTIGSRARVELRERWQDPEFRARMQREASERMTARHAADPTLAEKLAAITARRHAEHRKETLANLARARAIRAKRMQVRRGAI